MGLLAIVFFGEACARKDQNADVFWAESNAICVHWSVFGKENFDTKAIRIVLKSKSEKKLEFTKFYFRTTVADYLKTNVVRKKVFYLDKAPKIKQYGDYYYVSLSIPSQKLYAFFPEGNNYYNDDCYQIELANMIGQGVVFFVNNGIEVSVPKALDYSFYVGLK